MCFDGFAERWPVDLADGDAFLFEPRDEFFFIGGDFL